MNGEEEQEFISPADDDSLEEGGEVEVEKKAINYEEAIASVAKTVAITKVATRSRIQSQPTTSKQFFRARAKNPKLYTFTKDGNLQVPEIEKQPATVIQLPYYRDATPTEIEAYDTNRFSELSAIEASFDKTMADLRIAINDWRITGRSSTVLDLQMKLRTLDAERTALRSPHRWTKLYKNPIIRDIIFDNRYEIRHIGYDAYAYKTQIYPPTILHPETQENPRAKEREREREDEEERIRPRVISSGVPPLYIFKPADPLTGGLSFYSLLSFDYGTERYPSIAHAYEAQRLKEFGKYTVYEKILKKLKDPFSMRKKARNIVGDPSDPISVLLLIVRAASRRKPFAEALRVTDTAQLIFAEPDDNTLGVGLSADDVNIEDPGKWTGQNLYGKALMMVRKEIPEGELVDVVLEGGSEEKIDLEEDFASQERKRYFIGLNQRKTRFQNH